MLGRKLRSHLVLVVLVLIVPACSLNKQFVEAVDKNWNGQARVEGTLGEWGGFRSDLLEFYEKKYAPRPDEGPVVRRYLTEAKKAKVGAVNDFTDYLETVKKKAGVK